MFRISFEEVPFPYCVRKYWHDDILLESGQNISEDVIDAELTEEIIPTFPHNSVLGFRINDCYYISGNCYRIDVMELENFFASKSLIRKLGGR